MSVKELVRSTTTTPGVDDFSSTVGTPLVVDRTGKITYFLDSSNNVVAINGGGWTAAVSQGDLFYGSAANTIANLAKSATASYLDNSGSNNNPAWAAKAALTRVDDTNVTLTLGGTPTTSLLTATSITVGWSGTLAPTRGGTGLGSYTSGDIIYASAANTLAKLSVGTNGHVLTLAAGLPSWSATLPLAIGNAVSGGGANRLLYEDASQNLAASANLTFDGTTLTNLGSTAFGDATTDTHHFRGNFFLHGNAANVSCFFEGDSIIAWQTGSSQIGTFHYSNPTGMFRWSNDTHTLGSLTADGQLQLQHIGSSAGVRIGGDVDLYRSAANTLTIPDSVTITGALALPTNGSSAGISVGSLPIQWYYDSGTGWSRVAAGAGAYGITSTFFAWTDSGDPSTASKVLFNPSGPAIHIAGATPTISFQDATHSAYTQMAGNSVTQDVEFSDGIYVATTIQLGHASDTTISRSSAGVIAVEGVELAFASTGVTWANEATDTSCFIGFATAASGLLSPKTNANMTFNSSTGVATFGQTIVGSVNGNAATATALQTARTIGGTSFDGTANIVPATITVADTTDTTCSVGLWESATGDLGPKTDGGLTYNATTGMLTATGLTGPLTGNASTATALATPRTIGGTSFDGTANIVPATITVADTTDSTCFPALFESATGDLAPKTDGGLTYNASNGTLAATAFSGPLTGNVTGNLTGDVTGTVSGNAGTVTWADEATDTTCFIGFATAASGSLAPKTNANMTFNSNTGVVTFASAVLTTVDANGGTADNVVIGATTPAAITGTTITATGVVTVAAGSAANPSIIFSGSATSGIYQPAADQFGISLGGVVRWAMSSANTMIGTDTSYQVSSSVSPALQIHGATTSSGTVGMTNWNTDSQAPRFDFCKSASGSIGSHTVVANSDDMMVIRASGSNGTNFQAAMQIVADVDGAPGAAIPGRLVFFTTTSASTTLTEVMRMDSTQRVLAGPTTPLTIGQSNKVQIAGNATTLSGLSISHFAASAVGPSIQLSKSRSGTTGTNTIAQSGDSLGDITWYGADGTNYDTAAQIIGELDGTPTSNGTDMPGRIRFLTSADGSSTLTERMRIDKAGNVVVGNAAISTSATDGFLYVPTCAGTPTGTPTTYTGMAPIVINTTNNKLYFYSGGAWRDAGP
jgi:hypothetical protein